MSKRLENRKVLIIGGAAGIGLATTKLFLQHGACVAIADIDKNKLEKSTQEIKAGSQYTNHVLDITDIDAVSKLVPEIATKMSGLDILVNCAGIDFFGPFIEMTPLDWAMVMNVNLNGPISVCQAALPYLKASNAAAIINIASGAGLSPIPNRTAYCASKAGLIMATKSLALDLAAFDIRANVVCPGAIDTELFRSSLGDLLTKEDVCKRYALGRIGQPQDIANAILYLASDEASYVTGIAMAVDGGRTFH
ncbi:MAG: short-chain dehydrogenase [Blastopirellula sp.]|nr:MAG: short-chain dehydrogenase [Blastopirellula sp.]